MELIKKSTGEQLIDALHLHKFSYIWIQKLIDSALPVFIITVDSRRPSVYFGFSKLKKIDSTVVKRTRRCGINQLLMKNPKWSVPIPLEHYTGRLGSNAIIIRRDLGGEYFMDSRMYENAVGILKNIKII